MVVAAVLAISSGAYFLYRGADLPRVESIELSVWTQSDFPRGRISQREASASPLHTGDKLRLSVTLNQEAYLYVLWIGTEGDVTPIYPWPLGEWSRQEVGAPTNLLQLPARPDDAWRVESGRGGVETIIVLAARKPLPDDLDLAAMLSPMQSQEDISLAQPLSFVDGKLVPLDVTLTRSPNVDAPERILDPVLTNQLFVAERLSPYYSSMRALCIPITGS
jgi:hypothetical protein